MRTAIIIGGGWSVSQYNVSDLRARGHVIGVNESAVLQANHVGVTMDRLWAEHRARQFFVTHEGDLWVRKGADKHLPLHPRLVQFDCDHESTEMSCEVRTLNGTNSGMCALNYAYHYQPQALFLFGFDMCHGPHDEPYYHPLYEWKTDPKPAKYKDWSKQFDLIAKQFTRIGCTIYNVNNRSKIEAFSKISYAEFQEMTK